MFSISDTALSKGFVHSYSQHLKTSFWHVLATKPHFPAKPRRRINLFFQELSVEYPHVFWPSGPPLPLYGPKNPPPGPNIEYPSCVGNPWLWLYLAPSKKKEAFWESEKGQQTQNSFQKLILFFKISSKCFIPPPTKILLEGQTYYFCGSLVYWGFFVDTHFWNCYPRKYCTHRSLNYFRVNCRKLWFCGQTVGSHENTDWLSPNIIFVGDGLWSTFVGTHLVYT